MENEGHLLLLFHDDDWGKGLMGRDGVDLIFNEMMVDGGIVERLMGLLEQE